MQNLFRILLLIESGPEAFSVGSDRRIDSTSSDVIIKELRVFLGASIVGGSEAFCSSKSVCCVKNSLKKKNQLFISRHYI